MNFGGETPKNSKIAQNHLIHPEITLKKQDKSSISFIFLLFLNFQLIGVPVRGYAVCIQLI